MLAFRFSYVSGSEQGTILRTTYTNYFSLVALQIGIMLLFRSDSGNVCYWDEETTQFWVAVSRYE